MELFIWYWISFLIIEGIAVRKPLTGELRLFSVNCAFYPYRIPNYLNCINQTFRGQRNNAFSWLPLTGTYSQYIDMLSPHQCRSSRVMLKIFLLFLFSKKSIHLLAILLAITCYLYIIPGAEDVFTVRVCTLSDWCRNDFYFLAESWEINVKFYSWQ